MSLLKQNTTQKWQVEKNNATKLDVNKDDNEYKVEKICNTVVYAKKSASYLLGLYYLIF